MTSFTVEAWMELKQTKHKPIFLQAVSGARINAASNGVCSFYPYTNASAIVPPMDGE